GAWLMAAGCALYLIGGATFRWALQYASPLPRLGGALFSLVVAPAGLFGSPAAALAATTLVIAATLSTERLIDRSRLQFVEQ
ncbi:MAG TPA: hypothetical protein VEA16_08565, partial [Vicinamibacterales bacterium]|nr:hypothetical protein [Vicinamibacterales bacterium]